MDTTSLLSRFLQVVITQVPNDATLYLDGSLAWSTPTGTGGGGGIGGTVGTTANAITRANGTGGATLKGSVVTVADTTGILAGTQGITFSGSLSGTTALVPNATASGSLVLPAASDTLVGKATTDNLTNKTLTLPTIADFTNATHGHTSTATGGQLNATTVFSTGTVPQARLGSGSDGTGTHFLADDQTYKTITGTGDFVGPGSSTDNAIVRFDSTTGKLGQNSVGLLGDTGALTGVTVNANVVTAGTVDTARLGSGSASSSTFLRGDQTWSTPAGSGDVVGPGSATDNAAVRFDSTTGKLIQNGVVTIGDTGHIAGALSVTMAGSSSGTAQVIPPAAAGTGTVITLPGSTVTLASLTGSETLSSKTLTTPVIASFTNATHDHTNAAGGGTLTSAVLSDVTGVTIAQGDVLYGTGVNTVAALAKSTSATRALMNTGTSNAPAWGQIVETTLNLTDVTTANVSSSAHGFAPRNPNDATKYLDGTGNYTVPAGGGGGGGWDKTCQANRTAAQTITTGAAQAVSFTAADGWDTDTMHDTSSNQTKIVFTTAGVYSCVAYCQWTSGIAGINHIAYGLLNGSGNGLGYQSDWVQSTQAGGVLVQLPIFMVKAAASDYLEVMVQHTSGGSESLDAAHIEVAKVATG